MDKFEILKHTDHTNLAPTAKWEDIKALIDEGIEYGVASVCIAPSYVKKASEYADSRIRICTVIGFPNGYSSTATKVFEAEDAINNGADEIDMVINLGWVKDKAFDQICEEISAIRKATEGKVLKVIVETGLLSHEEKVILCDIVGKCGADYIKTSTGFLSGGATAEDIEIFAKNKTGDLKIKASGGIATIKDAETFLALGADRLGTSKLVRLIKEEF